MVIFRGSDRAQLNLNYVLIIPIANNQRRRRPAMQCKSKNARWLKKVLVRVTSWVLATEFTQLLAQSSLDPLTNQTAETETETETERRRPRWLFSICEVAFCTGAALQAIRLTSRSRDIIWTGNHLDWMRNAPCVLRAAGHVLTCYFIWKESFLVCFNFSDMQNSVRILIC